MSAYERDGFVFPVPVISEVEAERYRSELESAETLATTDLDRKILFGFANIVLPFVDEITRLPEVTAWIALTAATTENGCMQFVPGSHRRTIVEHRDTFVADNMLSRGQELAIELATEEAVDVVLEAGEDRFGNFRTFPRPSQVMAEEDCARARESMELQRQIRL